MTNKMTNKTATESDASQLDRLLLNCGLIAKFCRNNPCPANDRLQVDCVEQLVESSKFIDRISKQFFFENIPQNGFVQFLRIATTFTDLVVKQIKTKNKIERRTRKLFESIIFCADWLSTTYKHLKSEADETFESSLGSFTSSNCQHLVRKKVDLRSKHFYELINSDEDALASKFTRHLGFWLPTDIRLTFKTLNFVIALIYKLPWSLAVLWSEKYLGKYIAATYQDVNLNFPFNVWHLSENPFIADLVNCMVNFGVPVCSETLMVPRQKRFRLDSKGNILDFAAMTKEQIAAYQADETEQSRQNSPGLRHRNRETVKCRYSYIRSKEKIAESLERIKSKTKPIPKLLKYYTVRVLPDNGERTSDEINNNCETKACPDLEADFEVKVGDSKEGRPQPNDHLLEELGPNPDGVLLMWIHGGGLITQGAKSCETYLRKIVNSLGGVNCLAIDYSLTVPYPVPLQEVLDVYLWALSGGADVEEKLGFQPKKIVLAGDSGGGYFTCCLTIVLNELIKMLSSSKAGGNLNGLANGHLNEVKDPYPIPSLPLSLVTAYPAFSISNFAPSKTLFTLESLVEIHAFMLIISIYGANVSTIGDFKKIENSEEFQRIVAKNQDEFGNVEQMGSSDKSTDDSSPWFKCDYQTYRNYADYIDSWFNHPFINPVLYGDKFHELKDVALFTFAGTNDFLQDDSIELARMWKGKSTLDLFLNAVHGILSLTSVSTEANEAFEVIVERFQEACGLI